VGCLKSKLQDLIFVDFLEELTCPKTEHNQP